MKIIFFCGIMVAILGSGAFYASQKKQTSEFSEIQLANIEALATNEGGLGTYCYTNIKYTGSYNNMTLYCATCSYKYMYAPDGPVSRCP